MSDWARSALRDLAARVGYVFIPPVMSVDASKEVLRLAYRMRAEFNHMIERAEQALDEIKRRDDP